MKKSVTRDLTQGSPMKLILGFMLPLMLGQLFQQVYSMVDTAVVGKFLGVTALAGVGSTGAVNFLVLGFCSGICEGFAIPVAHKFGQRDYSGLRRFAANAVYLAAAFAAVITLAACVFCSWILEATNTDAAFFQEAYDYLFVIFLGIPAIMLYNLLAGFLRAMGDSRSPLYFLLISSVLNIALDLMFVCWFHMGVAGPAWATVISQAVSGLGCLVYMLKRFDILKMTGDEHKPSLFHMRRLCAMGIPMGMQYSVTAIGSVVLQSGINSFGTLHVAAVSASDKVQGLFTTPVTSIGTTMANYVGQNVGALRFDRVRAGVRSAVLMGVIYAVASLAIIVPFGDNIAMLFLDTKDTETLGQVLSLTQQYLNIQALHLFVLHLIFVYRCSIQSMGYSKFTIFAGALELVARCGITWVFTPLFGFDALCWACPIAWVAADLFLIPGYYICIRKMEKHYALPASAEA